MRYLAHTPEFRAAVERRRAAAMRRMPWPCRVIRAALDGYMEELRRMLDAPTYLGHGR